MSQPFADFETARLRAVTAEEKLRTLDALRRSALLLAAAGIRMRQAELTPHEVERAARQMLADAGA
ncbi:MAG: hypothetical protein AB7L66_12915 [Gemmatimonadales bacterium]